MKLTFRNKFGFGLGAIGKDIVYMLVSSYLLYYYNVVLGGKQCLYRNSTDVGSCL